MKENADSRRRMMQSVKSKNTKPEMQVRRLLHARGYRFRLHKRELPGSPDLVFPSREKVIFVNGCFWHGHACPNGQRQPKTNVAYWRPKISRNKARDEENLKQLTELGWKALVVWECEMENKNSLISRLLNFLGESGV